MAIASWYPGSPERRCALHFGSIWPPGGGRDSKPRSGRVRISWPKTIVVRIADIQHRELRAGAARRDAICRRCHTPEHERAREHRVHQIRISTTSNFKPGDCFAKRVHEAGTPPSECEATPSPASMQPTRPVYDGCPIHRITTRRSIRTPLMAGTQLALSELGIPRRSQYREDCVLRVIQQAEDVRNSTETPKSLLTTAAAAAIAFNSRSSRQSGATICNPTGSPFANPHGNVPAGWPVRLNG